MLVGCLDRRNDVPIPDQDFRQPQHRLRIRAIAVQRYYY